MREDGVALEHHADVALIAGHMVDHGIVKPDFTLFDGIEARDHAQQRGFAAAGGAEQREKFARPDFQADVLDRLKIAVIFIDLIDGDDFAHGKHRPCNSIRKCRKVRFRHQNLCL